MKSLIVGSGVSGRSAYSFLKNQNIEVEFAKESDMQAKEFDSDYLDRLFKGLSFIVKSPGVAFDNELIVQAKKQKIKIVGEFELGARAVNCDMVAVTGTNGKTTTATLLHFLFKEYYQNVYLGGNIGVPVTSFAGKTKREDLVVLECSSFQLEKIKGFKPHIAILLNITEDHLNRHKTMKNYIAAKHRVTVNQSADDFLIVNADDGFLMNNLPKTKAQVFYFSTKTKVKGCYVKNGSIYFNDNLEEKKLVSIKNIKLVGEHNLSNVVCACLAVYLQTKNESKLGVVGKFQGVAHRIEFVKKIDGISFYNDSKATNIDSTLVALKSFSGGINLILGGSDKGYSFDRLFSAIPKTVKNIAVCGETKHKIIASAEKFGFKNFYICESLRAATMLCFLLSSAGDTVLLSPACASFDCFSNFEERGNFFKKIVGEIDLNENVLFDIEKKT